MKAAKICPVCGKLAVPDAPQGLCPECLMKSGFDTRAPGEPGGGKSAFVPPSVEQMARLFPQLEVIELLGQGGMGAVYKARQPALGRFVALKILPPKSAADPGFAERFNREARALARLNHPNIVAVYDYGQAVDIPYFLMEYVEGSTLRQIVQAGKLSPHDTLLIVMQICEALQFAHGEGVVHRDIKPENILLDQKGRVKIADFGIAKVLDQPSQDISLTGAKDVVGTAHYMAPEQLEDPQHVDHRADIFSLGVVFYELLTGELPMGKFQSPSQKVQIDVRLDDVVLHSLEKEPDRRYQQASEVRTDVETIAATPGEGVPPVLGTPPSVQAGPPRAAGASTGVSLGVVAGVLGGWDCFCWRALWH
jgi:serine/threonine protein kinase